MILEVAILNIKTGLSTYFEKAFSLAEKYIKNSTGYVSH
jgi:heme-degrading monooxygenase HmoA